MERITYQELPQGFYENVGQLENYIHQSNIDFHLIELVKLRVSQINGCAYCVDMHHKELKALEESDLRLSSLVVWHETPYFSDKERSVLGFAEALNSFREDLDACIDELEKYFSKSDIAYLSLVVTQINTWNRLMKVLGTTPGNYQVPDRTDKGQNKS